MDYAKCNFLASGTYIWYVSIDKKRTSVSRNFGAKEIRAYLNDKLFFMVGVRRFELPAPWSQTTCATKLRYTQPKYYSPIIPFSIHSCK